MTLVAVGSLFPTACRRVGLAFSDVFREALWPALWPAAISLSLLAFTGSLLPATLPSVVLQLAISTSVYFGFFLLAVGPEGRREYLRHVNRLLNRSGRRVEAFAAGHTSVAQAGSVVDDRAATRGEHEQAKKTFRDYVRERLPS